MYNFIFMVDFIINNFTEDVGHSSQKDLVPSN